MMVQHSLQVASELDGKISVEVIDPRTLEPLDIGTMIASVKRTGRAVVVDEGPQRCGAAAEIATQITEAAFDFLEAPVHRVAAANVPIPGGVAEARALPQPADVLAAIERVVR